MKTTYFFTLSLCLCYFSSNAQDFRKAKWGDGSDTIRKYEVASFKDIQVQNKLENINFIEFTDKEVYYAYTYMVYENKLVGGKIKTAFLVKENSLFHILPLYTEALKTYKQKYPSLKEEKSTETGLNKFYVILKDRKIYGEIKNEGGEYHLLESIIKNKDLPAKSRPGKKK